MSEREEHDPFEDKKRRFVSCYEEHWLFPGRGSTRDKKEEAHEWWKLIAEVRLSDIEPLVESVASQWPKDKAPRRGLFKTAIRQLRAARAEDLPPLDDCALCDNSGMMWCLGRVAKRADGKEELTLSADPKDGPLSRFVTVCTCLRGRRFGDGDHRLQEKILDWRTNELLPSAENSDRDYGLTTVGKFHAEDLLHESFSAVRAEMAEKARTRPRVASAPKVDPRHSPEEKSSQNASQSHLEPILEPEPPETLPGGYTDDEVPF